jgi:hypothetical protein
MEQRPDPFILTSHWKLEELKGAYAAQELYIIALEMEVRKMRSQFPWPDKPLDWLHHTGEIKTKIEKWFEEYLGGNTDEQQ